MPIHHQYEIEGVNYIANELAGAVTQITSYNLGHAQTIVAQEDNARHIVVHGSDENATQCNP